MTGLQALEALKNGCTVRRAAWPEGQYAKIKHFKSLGIYRFYTPEEELGSGHEYYIPAECKTEDFLNDDWEPCPCTFKEILSFLAAGGEARNLDWDGKIASVKNKPLRVYEEHRVGQKSDVLCYRFDNRWSNPVPTETLMAWLESDDKVWVSV